MKRDGILVTGCAGFIGMHLCRALLDRGETVVGVDNLNDYYAVGLKKDRLARLESDRFAFHAADMADFGALKAVFDSAKIVQVCNLAAQAGVRYSIDNPFAYLESNVRGFLNLLELVKDMELKNLVYASSSSVYGGNEVSPFSVEHKVDRPISIYAATKAADELFAHVYHRLYGLRCTGLRFFTVYGPWGRPDMAYYKFSRLIMEGKPIEVYNHGEMQRDFTYIDDITAGVAAALDRPFEFEIFNLGNSKTEKLGRFIELLEENLGRKAGKIMKPMQPGDMLSTSADIEKSRRLLGFEPATDIEAGLERFCRWFFDYHGPEFAPRG